MVGPVVDLPFPSAHAAVIEVALEEDRGPAEEGQRKRRSEGDQEREGRKLTERPQEQAAAGIARGVPHDSYREHPATARIRD